MYKWGEILVNHQLSQYMIGTIEAYNVSIPEMWARFQINSKCYGQFLNFADSILNIFSYICNFICNKARFNWFVVSLIFPGPISGDWEGLKEKEKENWQKSGKYKHITENLFSF